MDVVPFTNRRLIDATDYSAARSQGLASIIEGGGFTFSLPPEQDGLTYVVLEQVAEAAPQRLALAPQRPRRRRKERLRKRRDGLQGSKRRRGHRVLEPGRDVGRTAATPPPSATLC